MKKLLFVIPMKDPALGKTRLAAALPAPARERLAMALFRQVLSFLTAHQPKVDVLVITGSQKVTDVACEYGAVTLSEEASGLSKAVGQAAEWAASRYISICVLPADLADPDAGDLTRLLSYPRVHPAITLAPSHDGGTNCLIATPPNAIAFRYGPGSSLAHQTAAQENGIPCTIAPVSSFAYDIDTSDDLHRFPDAQALAWS